MAKDLGVARRNLRELLPFDSNRLRALENRVLGKKFGPKSEEVIRECTRLHNVELYDLYSSPNIIQMTKLRKMRQAGHIRGT
jgi:hypothetical protein